MENLNSPISNKRLYQLLQILFTIMCIVVIVCYLLLNNKLNFLIQDHSDQKNVSFVDKNKIEPTSSRQLTLKEWQLKISSLEPGFMIKSVIPILGTNLTSFLDGRQNLGLQQSLLTVDNNLNWWIDNTGFHLKNSDGLPISDPTHLLKEQISSNIINSYPKDGLITYPSTNKNLTPIDLYLFTSLDCVFCRKLESQILDYQAQGINVHQIPFPRTGPNTPAWRLAEVIWCSKPEDRPALLQKAYAATNGDDVESVKDSELPDPSKPCASWVANGYKDAVYLNIPGTPGIFTDNGILIGGYIPPEQIRNLVSQMSNR